MTQEQYRQKLANLRLSWFHHVQEVTHNVSKTCRYYGIARRTYYFWWNRYQEYGLDGLKDRSKRPHHSPRATKPQIVEKIVYLRQHYYFGPFKIQMYLLRYHDIRITPSAIYRILKRLQMSRLPANQRYRPLKERFKRYEKPIPGHNIQIDVKFLDPIPGLTPKKFYQYTAIDDCTRIRILKIYNRYNQKNSIEFLDYVLAKLPFSVHSIQTDNGTEFGPQFHWHILDKGIEHRYIKPRAPRLNGKVERSHRIDEEEFYQMLQGIVIDDSKLFNEKLREWENFYNFQRPHGSLSGQTPFERLQEKLKELSLTEVTL
ncbi:MAG: IS481 family transposase [Thermodesulfobacteriota bacterium]